MMDQSTVHLDKRLATTKSSFQKFFEIASFSDVNSTYRNRSNLAKFSQEELVAGAGELLEEVPSSRNAVLHFISGLVHESVHQHFCERERKGAGKINPNIECAIQILIAKLDKLRIELGPKAKFSMQILKWLFETFSELSRHNHNRPSFNQMRPPSPVLLFVFQQIPCIAILLNLLQTTFNSILNVAPEQVIHAFVTAHKNFTNNFDWVTIYISDSFPSSILEHLIKTGAAEFQMHCNEIANSNPKCAPQLQKEYGERLRIFVDIFRYMEERNRKFELRNFFFTLITEFLQNGDHLIEIIYLVKLFLYSPEIILPYSDELIKLVIDPKLAERLELLGQNPSFKMALSPSNQLQEFTGRILEKASTNSIFNLIVFIGPIIHKSP